jgi:cobalamin synthase
LTVATVCALAIAAACDPRRGPAAFFLVAAATALWGWRCRRRIGGVTGDTLGSGVIMSECIVLLLWNAVRS